MLRLKHTSIFLPPLVLLIIGFVIYFLVVRFTTPVPQTIHIQPTTQQVSPSATPTSQATSSASP